MTCLPVEVNGPVSGATRPILYVSLGASCACADPKAASTASTTGRTIPISHAFLLPELSGLRGFLQATTGFIRPSGSGSMRYLTCERRLGQERRQVRSRCAHIGVTRRFEVAHPR